MPEFPPSEESLARLWRSGWCCGETAFALETGGIVWVVDGRNGENRLRAEGATALGDWHKADRVRAFVAQVRSRAEQLDRSIPEDSRLGRWLAWAERRADRIDPTIQLLATPEGGGLLAGVPDWQE